MVALLEAMPRRMGYVFATDAESKRAYSGTKRLKEIIDRESVITGWVFHHLRRSVRAKRCAAQARSDWPM